LPVRVPLQYATRHVVSHSLDSPLVKIDAIAG
jgi:hypothetical protein